MTFNQWCSGKRFDTHSRIALEAIWNALSGGGQSPAQCRSLLDDLLESLRSFKAHIQDHLTLAPVDELARASYPGMAHFAGTGPYAATCREYLFFAHGPHDYRSKNGKYRGLIEPARCNKYRQIMRQEGDKIPDDAAACKYFDPNETPPTRFAKS